MFKELYSKSSDIGKKRMCQQENDREIVVDSYSGIFAILEMNRSLRHAATWLNLKKIIFSQKSQNYTQLKLKIR
jgi:hypothetical protein